MQENVDLSSELDHKNGQPVFFRSLECIVAENAISEMLPLKFALQHDLTGIIGFKEHNSIICLDKNGCVCVGKFNKPDNDANNIAFDNYRDLLAFITKSTANWTVADNRMLVTNNVVSDDWKILNPDVHYAVIRIRRSIWWYIVWYSIIKNKHK